MEVVETVESHSDTARTVVFFLTSGICIAIFIPLLVYSTCKFNRYKNTIIMRKRYPSLIYLLILSIILICIRIPFSLLIHTPSKVPWVDLIQKSEMAIYIEVIVRVFLLHIVVFLMGLRFWMIFYKLNWAYASSTSAWKTVINPYISTNNWFLHPHNKRRYGNSRSMCCRFGIPYLLIFTTIDYILYLQLQCVSGIITNPNLCSSHWPFNLFELHLSHYQLFHTVIYLILMLIVCYLYRKSPDWEDHCFIRREMKYGSFLMFIGIIAYSINSITFLVLDLYFFSDDDIQFVYIQYLFQCYTVLSFCTVFGLLLTWYPSHKVLLKPSVLRNASSPQQVEMVLRTQRLNKKERNHSSIIPPLVFDPRQRSRTLSEPISPSHEAKKTVPSFPRRHSQSVEALNQHLKHQRNSTSAFRLRTFGRGNVRTDSNISVTANNQNHDPKHDHDDSTFVDGVSIGEDLNIILSGILSDSVLFDEFMNFLSRSFQAECLLGFVEFYQFKIYIIQCFPSEIMGAANQQFVNRLRLKLKTKRASKQMQQLFSRKQNGINAVNGQHRDHQQSSNKLSIDMPREDEPVTHGVLLPDSVPKSHLVYGDLLANSLLKGKPINKAMDRLERSASKYGQRLHKHNEKMNTMNSLNSLNHLNGHQSHQQQESGSKSKSTKTSFRRDKTPELTQLTEQESRSKTEALTIKLQHSNSGYSANSKKGREGREGRDIVQRTSRKKRDRVRNESASRKESASNEMYGGSYTSPKMRIPEGGVSEYKPEVSHNPIELLAMESVTEKDVYDEEKVGTPSMEYASMDVVSQTEPPDMTTPTMDMTRNITELRTDDENEESQTQTVTQTATTYLSATTKDNMMTGGVSVEVDEHLDKNREISVTPQPSQISQTSMLTSFQGPGMSMVSVTATKTPFVPSHGKKHKNSNRPITPFGSRQRFGSATATSVQSVGGISHAIRHASPSDTLLGSAMLKGNDQEEIDKDTLNMKPLELTAGAQTSNTISLSPSPSLPDPMDATETEGIGDVDMDPDDVYNVRQNNANFNRNGNGNGNGGNTNGENKTIIGYGDLPMDMEEARGKTRIIAHKLFIKYVKSGGEYEINIPSRMRRKFTRRRIHVLGEWVDEIKASIPELYTLFDECMEEMFTLMRRSITVFLESEDYQKIVIK